MNLYVYSEKDLKSKKEYPLKNKIRVFRAEMGWTQQTLSDITGISRCKISAIERAIQEPDLISAIKIACAFQKELSDIFYF